MKNYEEVTEVLLQRRDQYVQKQKQNRKTLTKAGTLLACCCLAALLGVRFLPGLPGGNVPLPQPDYGEGNKSDPDWLDDPDQDANRPVPDDNNGQTATPDDDMAFGTWHGKTVGMSLLEILQAQGAEEEILNILGRPGIDMTFVYKGKPLQHYWDASEAERTLPERMTELYKLGDALQYGEVLYTTGTPEGERWSEELYWETVEHIGQDLLEQYIVDGVFLKEKLWEAIENREYLYAAQAQWGDALEAYRADALYRAKGMLLQQGIEAYNPGQCISLHVTRAQFAALDGSYFAGWTFGLAEKDSDPSDMTDTDDWIADVSTDDVEIGVGFDDMARCDQP